VDADRGLTGPWLAVRWGVDPVVIEIRRRAGELYATRAPESDDWIYPGWQFDEDGDVKPEVARVLAAARDAGLSPSQLQGLFQRRVGLAGGGTMLDLLRQGDDRAVIAAISRRG
jgi:hypothetical protein